MRFSPYFLVFALLATAASGATVASLQESPLVEWPLAKNGNGHYYQAVSAPAGINWADAQQAAHDRGGYLATLDSKEENDFVFKLVDNPKFWQSDGVAADGPWLGGVKTPGFAQPGQGWHWINDDSPFTYTHWALSKPDNVKEREDRLNFWASSPRARQNTWENHDGQGNTPGFIIEYDAGPAPGSLKIVALAAIVALAVLVVISLLIFFFHQPQEKDSGNESA